MHCLISIKQGVEIRKPSPNYAEKQERWELINKRVSRIRDSKVAKTLIVDPPINDPNGVRSVVIGEMVGLPGYLEKFPICQRGFNLSYSYSEE